MSNKEKLAALLERVYCEYRHGKGSSNMIDNFANALATEFEEIVFGDWLYYSTTMMECSICKRHVPIHRYERCPHCGSHMSSGIKV